jgi:F-type H+-transporting ATPase subunit epsilon
MTARTFHLTVTTPLAVVVDIPDAVSLRAEDATGGFGILPGHTDFLTVLAPSVLRWRAGDGRWRFCAQRGGVLRVWGGTKVAIACREAVPGNDLATLEAQVRKDAETLLDAARRTRGESARLHMLAIRRLMRHLGPDGGEAAEVALEEVFR